MATRTPGLEVMRVEVLGADGAVGDCIGVP